MIHGSCLRPFGLRQAGTAHGSSFATKSAFQNHLTKKLSGNWNQLPMNRPILQLSNSPFLSDLPARRSPTGRRRAISGNLTLTLSCFREPSPWRRTCNFGGEGKGPCSNKDLGNFLFHTSYLLPISDFRFPISLPAEAWAKAGRFRNTSRDPAHLGKASVAREGSRTNCLPTSDL